MSYKKDFPIFKNNKKLIYLDSAATSQKPKIVINSINNFYSKYNSNVHRGIYSLAEEAEYMYEEARKKISKFINADLPLEIIFTSNTTESINLAAFGYFKKVLKKDDVIILSEMEHHSNIVPWLELKKLIGIKIYYLPINENYELDFTKIFSNNLNPKRVKLISLTHASNVLGTINPLENIIPLLKKKYNNAKILIDAAQSIPHIKVDVKKLNTDFLAFSSHKLFGPSGLGILYVNKSIINNLDPILFGGHMISSVNKDFAEFLEAPAKLEAGTGKIEAVIGLGIAIDYIAKIGIKNVQAYENRLTNYAIKKLFKIKGVKIFGKKNLKNRLPVFSFNINNVHPHDSAEILNRYNICTRAGHHCAQILMDKLDTPQGTIRASFSIYNTKEDVDKLIEGIKEVKKVFKIK